MSGSTVTTSGAGSAVADVICAMRPSVAAMAGWPAGYSTTARAAALQESGDIVQTMREGRITEAHVRAELGEIVSGAKPGRAVWGPGKVTK